MTQNQIITVTARKNMVRARAGEIQLPKIVGFVWRAKRSARSACMMLMVISLILSGFQLKARMRILR